MIIAWEHKDTREICENEIVAIDTFGDERASILKSRLSDIEAAESMADIEHGIAQKHEDNDTVYSYGLNSIVIIFVANHLGSKIIEPVTFNNISRIKIIKIECHE